MATWVATILNLLWNNALAAIFPAMVVGLICFCVRCRPVTRHALWLIVLLLFILPPVSNTWHLHIKGWWINPRASEQAPERREVAGELRAKTALPDNLTKYSNSDGKKTKYVRPERQLRSSEKTTSPTTGGWEQAAANFQNSIETPPRTGVGANKSTPSRGTGIASVRHIDLHPSTHPKRFHCNSSSCECHVGAESTGDCQPTKNSPAEPFQFNQLASLLRANLDRLNSFFKGLADHAAKSAAEPVGTDGDRLDEPLLAVNVESPQEAPTEVESNAWLAQRPTEPGLIQNQISIAKTWSLGVFTAIRSALERLPQMPAGVWIFGTAFLILLQGLSAIRFRRVLKNSSPAPPSITAMVSACAASLNMRGVPDTRMISGRWSPMVIGLVNYRLIIPKELWRQLDDVGRRAILLHELAHLRRRDLWVRRLDMLVTTICWWHPLVWYARRRIRDEAELCCDAWVTWLLPQERRAYASALLRAQQYIRNHPAEAPMGIGVVSGRARRFARRLTMVMTNQNRPGLSWAGFATAIILAMAGWLAAPVWACPDEEETKHKHPRTDEAGETPEPGAPTVAPAAVAVPMPPVAPHAMVTPAPGAPAVWAVTPHAALAPTAPLQPLLEAAQAAWGHDDRDLEARMRRLEEQLRRLEQALDRMTGQAGQGRGGARIGTAFGGDPAPRSGPFAAAQADGPKIARTYQLSKGKLEALVQLMSRDDVPVLIRHVGDGIEVQATQSQHEVMRAFIDMIEPGGGRPGEVRQRSAPRTPRPPQAPRPGARGRQSKESAEVQEKMREAMRAAQGKEHEAHAKAVEQQVRALNKAAQQVQRDSEKIQQQADRLREKADQLREKADAARSQADEVKQEAGDEHKITELSQKAEALDDQASAMDQQAGDMEAQARDVEQQSEEIERQIEAIEEAREQAEEAVSEAQDADSADDADEDDDSDDEQPVAKVEETSEGKDWYDRGYALYSDKEYAEAVAAFQKSVDMDHRKADSLYNIACCYSLQGDGDNAMQYLHSAWDAGFTNMGHIEADSDLDKIRDDSRYREFIKNHS